LAKSKIKEPVIEFAKEIKETDFKPIFEIWHVLKKENHVEVLKLMKEHNISDLKINTFINDMYLSLYELELRKAAKAFEKSSTSVYRNKNIQFTIKRENIDTAQGMLLKMIDESFKNRGGIAQFHQNRKVYLKHKDDLYQQVFPIVNILSQKEDSIDKSSIAKKPNKKGGE